MTSVLLVSPEPVGERMAGPAIRSLELARALAATCDVTVAAAAPSAAIGLPLLEAGMGDVERLVRAARQHDVVVAQELPPVVIERLARGPAKLVADLYNPQVVEVLEGVAGRAPAEQRRLHRRIVARSLAMCAAADLVLCANERQRDLWIGGMALHGLIEPGDHDRDPALRERVMVIPFGLPDGPPPEPSGALRRAFPAIGPGERVLVWGGGLWGWLDPVTPMRAVRLLAERGGPRVHLVLLGAARPALAASGQAGAGERALAAAREGGLLGELVHVNAGWVPYAERGGWLADADLGVTAHHDHLEARYAHRTRVLDYLWAGLPVVATRGDALAEAVERDGFGAAVPPGDPAAFAGACARLLGPDGAVARGRIAAAAPGLRWSTAVAPLAAWCATAPANERRPVRRGVVRRAGLAQYRWAFGETLAGEGPAAAARRVGRRLRRAVRLR
jgi:glycosyltransferase involved in cell wall biosynthesis